MPYPNRIRELRKLRKLSLQALADRIGTSNQQIYRLEKGARQLTQKWMSRLSAGLGVDPRELLPMSETSETVDDKKSKPLPPGPPPHDLRRDSDELVEQLSNFVRERMKAVNQYIDRGPSHFHLAIVATEGLAEDIRRILALTGPSKSDPNNTSTS